MKRRKRMKMKTKTQRTSLFPEEVYLRLMGPPLNEDEKKTEPANVTRYIDLGYFAAHVDMEIEYENSNRIMKVAMATVNDCGDEERFDLQCAINEVNNHFMKLGHFAVDPESMNVYFIATVTLYGDEANYERDKVLLDSLVVGGVQAFIVLGEVFASGIDAVIKKYIERDMKQQKSHAGTLH
jgi:hypothetical protein